MNNKYNRYLTPLQIAFRDFIKEYNLVWSFWLTLRYQYKPTESKVNKDINLIQRHIGKTLKSQILYFGIYSKSRFNNFSHVHLLVHTKKHPDTRNTFDLLLLKTTIKDFFIVNAFPFKGAYNLQLINQDDSESMQRISQYLCKKSHMTDGSYSIICSNPKKLKKFLS